MFINKDFSTWLLIDWQQFKGRARKSLLTKMDLKQNFFIQARGSIYMVYLNQY